MIFDKKQKPVSQSDRENQQSFMQKKCFVIFDIKSGAITGDPQFFNTHGEALRWFTDVTNNEKSYLNRHPDDFVFFEIGSLEWDTMMFVPNVSPYRLSASREVVMQKPLVSSSPAATL